MAPCYSGGLASRRPQIGTALFGKRAVRRPHNFSPFRLPREEYFVVLIFFTQFAAATKRVGQPLLFSGPTNLRTKPAFAVLGSASLATRLCFLLLLLLKLKYIFMLWQFVNLFRRKIYPVIGSTRVIVCAGLPFRNSPIFVSFILLHSLIWLLLPFIDPDADPTGPNKPLVAFTGLELEKAWLAQGPAPLRTLPSSSLNNSNFFGWYSQYGLVSTEAGCFVLGRTSETLSVRSPLPLFSRSALGLLCRALNFGKKLTFSLLFPVALFEY